MGFMGRAGCWDSVSPPSLPLLLPPPQLLISLSPSLPGSLEAFGQNGQFLLRFLLCLGSRRQINGCPRHVPADGSCREHRTELGSHLFISRSAKMCIWKQLGKVDSLI